MMPGRVVPMANGVTCTNPLTVANHNRSSCERRPAGQKPLAHSRLSMPSVLPNASGDTAVRVPVTKSFNSARETRDKPRLPPSQKLPATTSSTICDTTFSRRPCSVVMLTKRSCTHRASPPPPVPTHSKPVESTISVWMKSLPKPCRVVNASNPPSRRRNTPIPPVPTQSWPSGCCAKLVRFLPPNAGSAVNRANRSF